MSEPTKGPYRAMRAHGTMRLPPGFWEVDILDSDNHPVGWAVGNTREQAEANAHLLAAAPELREALQWCLDNSEESLGDHTWQMRKVRAALAKAEGKV
jgi:hypothetical protein